LKIFEEDVEIVNEVLTETSYTAHNLELEYKAYRFEIYADYDCDISQVVSITIDASVGNARLSDIQDLKVWTGNGELYLQSNKNQNIVIYSIIGRKIKELQLNSDKTAKITLPKGVYILHNGEKAIKVVI
jgi:hypothetical protein